MTEDSDATKTHRVVVNGGIR
jgi:hypothetical protein